MNNNKQGDDALLGAVPLLSLGLGVVSAVFAAMSMIGRRADAVASIRRVYYVDGRCLVSVRHIGQWHDIRDFVTPNDPEVQAVYAQIGPDIWGCLDWVCRNISYRRDVGEFWYWPNETIKTREGDCDDSSNLLTSLLRNFTSAYTVLGTYCGYGHAWTEAGNQLLESTFTYARYVPDPQNYIPFVYFNDVDYFEVWPGALQDIYALPRREPAKLRSMSHAQ